MVELVGVISGFLSREGTQFYTSVIEKPAASPPGILFPVVWTILYGLMAVGAARIAASTPGKWRSRSLNIFVIQLIVNFFWSLIFFNAGAYGLAFLWLLLLGILVLDMIILFYQVDKPAALIQIPYLLWIGFAGYLSYMVWNLNS